MSTCWVFSKSTGWTLLNALYVSSAHNKKRDIGYFYQFWNIPKPKKISKLHNNQCHINHNGVWVCFSLISFPSILF